jgi:hypothetical protein
LASWLAVVSFTAFIAGREAILRQLSA